MMMALFDESIIHYDDERYYYRVWSVKDDSGSMPE